MQFVQYNEQKQRGTPDFPAENYHLTPHHPQYVMAFHWHLEYEILLVREGTLQVTLDDRHLAAKAGDLVFIPGGTLHAGEPENCVYDCAVFDPKMLTRKDDACSVWLERLIGREIAVLDIPPADPMLSLAAEQLFSAMEDRPEGWQLLAKGALCTLFGLAVSKGCFTAPLPGENADRRKVEQLKKVLTLIEEQYAQPLTLADLSAAAGMSPKYFCRFFQELTHRTPIEYLNSCRIEHACCMLLGAGRSVTEVALACGYNDLSYFDKTFKRHKGVTPRQYLRGNG